MDDWFSTLLEVSDLPPDRAQELHELGFVVLTGPTTVGQTDHLARAYDAAVASAAEDGVRTGSTSTRVTDFVNRGTEFDEVYISPPLLEACCRIIGRPFKLSSFQARTLRPGSAAQELHADVPRDSADWPLVGFEAPVFTVGGVTFGVLLCRDSLFAEPARLMVSRGAQILFVPTNNGMPPAKGGPELVEQARACDVARAAESGVPVVRADVAGVAGDLVSYGSSGIVNRDGHVLGTAPALASDLVIAAVDILVPGHQGSPADVGAAFGVKVQLNVRSNNRVKLSIGAIIRGPS